MLPSTQRRKRRRPRASQPMRTTHIRTPVFEYTPQKLTLRWCTFLFEKSRLSQQHWIETYSYKNCFIKHKMRSKTFRHSFWKKKKSQNILEVLKTEFKIMSGKVSVLCTQGKVTLQDSTLPYWPLPLAFSECLLTALGRKDSRCMVTSA